ncbi:proliferating cell nuclear antigen, N-terminal domain-containing protein [Mycena sp. CBHHK59/15]|nr:proliferating cell nuclear antigen, N-terminal domain-containing protein [Mycena sp. CBHHK59/15]
MLEAKLAEAGTLKKLLDAIKELVTDANFECNEEGINLQAMDNSHVALVSVHLEAAGFKRFRCDRPMPLGVNLSSLTKVLKCAKDDDECTIKAADEADVLNLVYEAKNSDRIAEYDMKLMDIDSDTLGIPDTDYDAEVKMPSAEFARIVRDLGALGESVRIEVSKEGVRFASEGESANGSVLLKQDGEVGRVMTDKERKAARARARGEEPEEDEDEEENDDEEEKPKKEKKIKKEKVKKEKDVDEDVEMDEEEKGAEEFKPNSDNEDEDEKEVSDNDEDDDEESGKKRKKKANGSSKPAKKAKVSKGKGKGKKEEEEKPIFKFGMNSHVSLTFSLKYLVNFSKSASLSNTVELRMSNDVPLLVDYDFGQGYVRYYLAPKIGDE